jgi:hypothetical protein
MTALPSTKKGRNGLGISIEFFLELAEAGISGLAGDLG